MPKLYIQFNYVPKPSTAVPKKGSFKTMSVELGELQHAGNCQCRSCSVARRVWEAVSKGKVRGEELFQEGKGALQEGIKILGALKSLGIL